MHDSGLLGSTFAGFASAEIGPAAAWEECWFFGEGYEELESVAGGVRAAGSLRGAAERVFACHFMDALFRAENRDGRLVFTPEEEAHAP